MSTPQPSATKEEVKRCTRIVPTQEATSEAKIGQTSTLHEVVTSPSVLKPEPMLLEAENRLCLFPIVHHDLDKNWNEQVLRFWVPSEMDLSQDPKDWDTMNSNEQKYISMTLAFFANSDNAVMDNIANRFRADIQWPEALQALAAQAFMESIHVRSYNLMINSVIKNRQERLSLFQAVKTHPIIKLKIDTIQKYCKDPLTPIHVCLVAQCFSEGIGFCASFCSMNWMRLNNKCPGICFGNEKIMEDESLHVTLFATLYRKCQNKMSSEEIVQMCQDFVAVEDRFVDECLPYNVKGMNKNLMKLYVRCVADIVLILLGEPKHYKTGNPFPWMEKTSMLSKSNYFEKRVSEYQILGDESEIHTTTFENLGDDLDF